MPDETIWAYNHRITVHTDDPAGDALKNIAKGNEEFMAGRETDYFAEHHSSQTPYITMVTCSDSRVQSRALLPDSVNRIFTIRNIGNQIESSEGSVDYGVLHLNTPILLILGHADCGAIKAFMGGYGDEPRPIKKELDHMREGFSVHRKKLHRKGMEKGDDWDMEKDVPMAVQANVDHQVQVALKKYRDLVKEGKLTVVGGFYDFRDDAGRGHGRLVILNVNGETDAKTLEELPIVKNVHMEVRELHTGRL